MIDFSIASNGRPATFTISFDAMFDLLDGACEAIQRLDPKDPGEEALEPDWRDATNLWALTQSKCRNLQPEFAEALADAWMQGPWPQDRKAAAWKAYSEGRHES